MKARKLPPLKYVNECFRYYSTTGKIVWKPRPAHHFENEHLAHKFNSRFAGAEAGTLKKDDRIQICLDGVVYKAHRIAWLLYHGIDPGATEIDHRNGKPSDNRIKNLRLASRTQQRMNSRAMTSNKLGIKGIHYYEKENVFIAQFRADGVMYRRRFRDLEKAKDWIRKERQRKHREFTRH